MRTRLRILGGLVATSVVAVAVPLISSTEAVAAPFTGGNLVVYRVGTGTAPLTNAATAVFLDEFSPTGTKVQSIALPTAAADGNAPLTAAGQSLSEGLLSSSPDGSYVALTGYAAVPGTLAPGDLSLTATAPATVARTVGIVDGNGVVDTSTVLTGVSAPKVIRSAVTVDGDRVYAAGGNGGISTTTLGSATVETVAGTDASNLNALSVQGGQLFTSGTVTNRLATVGTGVPTAAGATLTDLSGLPDNLLSYGYSFVDLTSAGFAGTPLDTLYVANASLRGGTVDKYRFDGTTWVKAGYVDVPGATGLVADVKSGAVSLAVTTPTKLVALNEAAAAGTTFTPAAPVTLATAAANTEFRGVALAPTAADAGPSVFIRTPASGTTADLSTGSVPVTAYVAGPKAIERVRVKIGSGAFVNATKDAGNLWTAAVPAGGLTEGASTLTVAATDAAGTTTRTRDIQLSGSSVPAGALAAGTYAWDADGITADGGWKSYKSKTSPSGKGLTSKAKGDTLSAIVYGKSLVLSFDTSAKAGKVKVTVDGKSTTIDLYSASADVLKKTFKFKGALAAHDVAVTVLGSKAKASSGTAVFAAAAQVK